MSRILLQPAASESAQKHFRDTVEQPVELTLLAQHISEAELQEIALWAHDGRIPVWGVAPSDDGQNEKKWENLRAGDIVLFSQPHVVRASGTVAKKTINESLAVDLWHPQSPEEPWSYIYFLTDVQFHKIEKRALNKIIGHSPGDRWQRVNLLDETKSLKALQWLQLEPETQFPAMGKGEFGQAVQKLFESPSLDAEGYGNHRIEQSFLRKCLFEGKSQEKCGICGHTFPIEFLVAAHIKRRSDCTLEERLDYQYIVMPMCKFGCDELYERHYITVKDGIVKSKGTRPESAVIQGYISSIDGQQCLHWNDKTRRYFDWHAGQPKA